MSFKKYPNIFTNKTLLIQIIFVAIAAGGMFIFERFSGGEQFLTDNTSKNGAMLTIDFDNVKRRFGGEVFEKMTVLDALNASVAAGEIKLIYIVDSDNNTDVIEINDHTVAKDKNFYFYVNKNKMDVKDLNKTYVYPGDKITVRLE